MSIFASNQLKRDGRVEKREQNSASLLSEMSAESILIFNHFQLCSAIHPFHAKDFGAFKKETKYEYTPTRDWRVNS